MTRIMWTSWAKLNAAAFANSCTCSMISTLKSGVDGGGWNGKAPPIPGPLMVLAAVGGVGILLERESPAPIGEEPAAREPLADLCDPTGGGNGRARRLGVVRRA